MFFREIDFAEILAHFRRNVVELQLGVNFLFSLSRNRLLAVECGQAVLVQRVTHLQRSLAQGHIVGFRSREVLHSCSERIRRQQAHVDLHSAAQVEADLVVAAGDHIHERRILRHVRNGLLSSFFGGAGFSGNENVQVPHCLASSPQGSRRRDLVDTGKLLEIRGEFFGFRLGCINQKAPTNAAIVFDGLEQLRLVLFAHARQFANLALSRQFLDTVHIADFVGAPDERDRLRPQSLNLQQLQHRRAVLLQQFRLHRQLAVFEEFLEIAKHAFADAGNFEDLLRLSDEIFYRLRMILNRLRGVAVRANAEGILPIDLEQVGSLVKNIGDGLVVHVLQKETR